MHKKLFSTIISLCLLAITVQVSAVVVPIRELTVGDFSQQLDTQATEWVSVRRTEKDVVKPEYTSILPKNVRSFYDGLFSLSAKQITEPTFPEQDVLFYAETSEGFEQISFDGYAKGFRMPEGDKNIHLPYAVTNADITQMMTQRQIPFQTKYTPTYMRDQIGGGGVSAGAVSSYIPPYDILVTTNQNTYQIGWRMGGYFSYNDYPDWYGQIDENPDVVPYIDETTNRTMIPIRCLAELLGFRVSWVEDAKEIMLEKDGYTVSLFLDSYDYKISYGDQTYTETSDAAPIIRNERTFVPLRLVAEAFGCTLTLYNPRFPAITTPSQKPSQNIYIIMEPTLYTYPFINGETYEIGLKSYPSSYFPMHTGNQLLINIYDAGGKRQITYLSDASNISQRTVFATPDTYSVTMPKLNHLPKGTYYADIQYSPTDKNVYRIFFEAK